MRCLTFALLLLAGCGSRPRTVREDPKTWKSWVPEDGAFTITAPKPPDIRMQGFYDFYGVNMRAMGPLLEVRTGPLPPPGAVGVPPAITPERYESAYRSEPGAEVEAKDITNGSYTGREIDITAGRRAPLVIRIFQVNGHQYWLEWNPKIDYSTELANTLVIP